MQSDFEQILTLSWRYSRTLNARQIEDWLLCWTPEGYFERYQSAPRARGHEALAEMLRSQTVSGRHMTSEYVIAVNGDQATQECYLILLDLGNACAPAMFGTYRDELRRTPEGWKFSQRIFDPDYIAEWLVP